MIRKEHTAITIILILTLFVSCALAVGWAIHCRAYKSRQRELTAANTTLRQRADLLQNELDALKAQAEKTLEELLATNGTLADTNETLLVNLGGFREMLEAVTSENINLIKDVRQLHEDSQKQSAHSRETVSQLTATVVALTGDLKTANGQLGELMDKLQSKTKETAELAIKVNTLVEMVARLRVTTGATTGPLVQTDPNSVPTADANSPPKG